MGQFVCHWQGRGTLRDPPRPPRQIAPEAPCPPATADFVGLSFSPGRDRWSLTCLSHSGPAAGGVWARAGLQTDCMTYISIKGVTQCSSRTASGRAGALPHPPPLPLPQPHDSRAPPRCVLGGALRCEGGVRGQTWQVLCVPAS